MPLPAARPRARWTALAAALCLGALGCGPPRQVVSGTVESRRVTVAAETGARVLALHVREGQRVAAGELLVELDPAATAAGVDAAAARLAQAEADLALLEAGPRPQEVAAAEADLEVERERLEVARLGARREQIEQLEAALAAVRASIGLARLELARELDLLASGDTAEARVDEARARLEELEARERLAGAQLSEARAGARPQDLRAQEANARRAEARLSLVREGARAEERAAARARVAAARAELSLAREEAARCRVVAPLDGRVEVVDLEPGELAQPGQPLLALAREGVLRVRTFAPQHVIGALAVDDTLRIEVDGRPGRAVAARVERIWDEAEFTTGNVQTPDDRMLLCYRVDLEVAPDPQAGLRPGATVLVDFGSQARP